MHAYTRILFYNRLVVYYKITLNSINCTLRKISTYVQNNILNTGYIIILLNILTFTVTLNTFEIPTVKIKYRIYVLCICIKHVLRRFNGFMSDTRLLNKLTNFSK